MQLEDKRRVENREFAQRESSLNSRSNLNENRSELEVKSERELQCSSLLVLV